MTNTLFSDTFEFCSLGSGSSGNSYYIGDGEDGFLIDAGINGQHIKHLLQSINIQIDNIKGIIITHDHIDHIRALNALTRIYNIPVYANFGTWQGILNNRFSGNVSATCHNLIDSKSVFHLAGFTIQAFNVSHDAQEPVGYHITKGEKTLTLATDLGMVGELASVYLSKANIVIIESNYDEEMLLNGPYSKELKNRILGEKGHLDNKDAARFIADNYNEKMSHIFLCHLSQENNTPELALKAVAHAIKEKDVMIHPNTSISALPRTHRSELYSF